MPTVTVAASKGGVGKSTLCFCLAVMASKSAKVGMLDWEPQGSISFWHAARGRPDNPALLKGDDPVQVAKRNRDLDWIFIDTPPSGLDQIERAIQAADFVLVPVHVSALDIAAIRPVAAMCQEYKKPFAFVLNEVLPRTKTLTANSIDTLEDFGPVLDVQIVNRLAYVTAINTDGRTAPEHPDSKQAKEARTEIATLWTAVKKLASKGVKV